MTIRVIPENTELSRGLDVQPTHFDAAAARHGEGRMCRCPSGTTRVTAETNLGFLQVGMRLQRKD